MRRVFIFIVLVSILLSACEQHETIPEQDDILPILRLDIGREALQKIKRKRAEALAIGLLESSGKDFVPCHISMGNQQLAAEVRLKGDWLDHLKGSQWSWRVKLMDGTLLGMRQFSLQHPKTRGYLLEWLFHQQLQEEGLLSPRYQFVRLWLNGEYKGIYALEEHFTSDLLANARQPESVIMKYDESGFWESQNYRLRYGVNVTPHLPVFEAADIDCFQSNRSLKDDRLFALFAGGQVRMEQLRASSDSVAINELIDVDYWAKFFALIDVMEAYHALRWHNMRFYYHPLEARLYPIAFDGYGSDGIYRWLKKPFLAYVSKEYPAVYFRGEYFLFRLFNDPHLRQAYYQYLNQFSAPEYLDQMFARSLPELKRLDSLLVAAYEIASYQPEHIYQRAERLRDSLAAYDYARDSFAYLIYDPLYAECKTSVPLPSVGLQAWQRDSQQIIVHNFYCQDIQLEATGPKRNRPLHPLPKPIPLKAFDIRHPPPAYRLDLVAGDRYVFYSIPEVDYWFKTKFELPLPVLGIDKFSFASAPLDSTIFIIRGQEIRIPAGKYVLDKRQYIPPEFELIIDAGASIDLRQGAALFVGGPTRWRGTATQPILCYSSDGKGRGVHFLQGDGVVQLQQVHFSHLQAYQGSGRWFNGAVSAYRRPVHIEACSFVQLEAEDGLNIVACDSVFLQDLDFNEISGDALDLDFCTGQLSDLRFKNCAGDALDLSGSNLVLHGLKASHIADKCISIGESTRLQAEALELSQSAIGIALKDGSYAEIKTLHLEDCEYGLVAFQKKATYPPGSILLNGLTWGPNIEATYLSENQYPIILEGDTLPFSHARGVLVKQLYPIED